MWMRNVGEIKKYIPNDGKLNDIQILNNEIYVNGVLVIRENEVMEDPTPTYIKNEE